jgi:hypothetical protein
MKNIKFSNFPPDLNPKDNIFIDAIKDIDSDLHNVTNIHFYGCYPNIKFIEKAPAYIFSKISNKGMVSWLNNQQGIVEPENKNDFNIWVTFENRRAPHQYFDLTISFDIDDYQGTNLYFPLIFQYMNVKSSNNNYSKHNISPHQATQKRIIPDRILFNKKNFMVSFINNPHPTRLRAQNQLSKIGSLAEYGRSVNNYAKDKISTTEEFWFSLCFENDLYPGYVTEKALEAWLGWSIPLWWGDDANNILNPKAIINLAEFATMAEFTQYVSNLYKDKDRMIEMLSQPLLIKDFQYQSLVEFISAGLKKKFEI